MFLLRPPPEWRDYCTVQKGQKFDASGLPLWEQWPTSPQARRPLKDYPGLPNEVSEFRIGRTLAYTTRSRQGSNRGGSSSGFV